ncbi:hypothetical protein [Vagococcus fluvialis]|uniref:hypothetical protein n=1 Tax=Vagococcus fluvialis TaxID=2738 RepID=UPI002B31B0F8|nr:hypothetical protein QDW48_14240 [Vagococcus fluvialis]
MKKLLRSKTIILFEIILLFLTIWSEFYPWSSNYSWEISISNPIIKSLFILVLISTTFLAMIENNKFILISNSLIFLLGLILVISISQYLQQFLP